MNSPNKHSNPSEGLPASLQLAITRLEARAASTPAKMYGLSEDLRSIAQALSELDRRSDLLAAFALRQYFGIELHHAQIQALASCGPEAAAVYDTLGNL